MDASLRKSMQLHILNLLAENEAAMAALYLIYAAKFPLAGELWPQLAKEEQKHAELLRNLQPLLEQHDLFAAPETFKFEAIQAMRARVLKMAADCQERHVEEGGALINSMSLESGFLEGGFFQVGEQDHPAYAKVARALASHSETHRLRIEKFWKIYEQQRATARAAGMRTTEMRVKHPHGELPSGEL